MKKILFVIPAYNEEMNILETCNKIFEYNNLNKTNYDIVVINDASTDKTSLICHENKIPVIDLIQNLGIGGAVQTGYKYAKKNDYDIVIQFDGDGQHDVNYVKEIIKPILNNEVNMVIGSRFIDEKSSDFKSTKARRIGINIISKVIQLKTKYKIYDTTSGFRAIDKNLIDLFSNDYPTEYPEPISTVNVLKHKYLVKEVPVSMNERKGGVSSITSWKNAYYMFNVILSILLLKKVK